MLIFLTLLHLAFMPITDTFTNLFGPEMEQLRNEKCDTGVAECYSFQKTQEA